MADPLDAPLSALLPEIYRRLYAEYGPQHWWPGEGPFEVIVGAILTQSAAWTNVEKALANMKAAGCWSFETLHRTPEAELAEIVRPSGYFNAKTRKLKAFAAHISGRYGGKLDALLAKDTSELREELLAIHGIGEETADDIIVYAAGKPSFVIDAYSRRIVDRMGLTPDAGNPKYRDYQALFHNNLAPETALFNEFHALLDHHAKIRCTKRAPQCEGCCLAGICATGLARPSGPESRSSG